MGERVAWHDGLMWFDERGSEVLTLAECRRLVALGAHDRGHGHLGLISEGVSTRALEAPHRLIAWVTVSRSKNVGVEPAPMCCPVAARGDRDGWSATLRDRISSQVLLPNRPPPVA